MAIIVLKSGQNWTGVLMSRADQITAVFDRAIDEAIISPCTDICIIILPLRTAGSRKVKLIRNALSQAHSANLLGQIVQKENVRE